MLYISGMYAVLFMYGIVPKDQYTKTRCEKCWRTTTKLQHLKPTQGRQPCQSALLLLRDIRNAHARFARRDLCVVERHTHARRFYHELTHALALWRVFNCNARTRPYALLCNYRQQGHSDCTIHALLLSLCVHVVTIFRMCSVLFLYTHWNSSGAVATNIASMIEGFELYYVCAYEFNGDSSDNTNVYYNKFMYNFYPFFTIKLRQVS